MKRKWLWLLPFLLGGAYFLAKQYLVKKTQLDDKTPSFTKMDGDSKSYWTCPMHPQVHMDHPGECPICRMKLVKISEDSKQEQTASSENIDHRVGVKFDAAQFSVAGIQKLTVEKMNLSAHIPVSGRLLSGSQVAFQVYESDLRYIQSGLAFTGEGSIYPERTLKGVITSVDSIVDPTSRTVRVVGEINHPSAGLIAETSFSGDIKIELKNKIAIPASSVLHTGNQSLVYLVKEDRLTPSQVTLGTKADGFYEVVTGLNEGDVISAGPNFLLDSESKIRGAE